jgi:EAL and modified HD-GYP domain-containing signal transduction protein
MSDMNIYLGRQPIVDRNQELVGFELLFRDGPLNAAKVTDDTHATSTVVSHAFSELGLGNALGCMDCFLNVDTEFLLDDAIELLPTATTVLEILESVVATPDIVARCEALRAMGFRIAIDDIVRLDDPRAPLFSLTAIFKIDLMLVGDAALPPLVAGLRKATTAMLLAEKVDEPARFASCKALGFDLFQGYYFARPTVLSGRKLDSSKVVLMKLLTQIIEDVDTPVLENSFKQAPGLSVNLLRLVNSVASGLKVRISSLRHAITVLGRRQLQRWLQLLLYTDPSGATKLTNPLLQLAATRGRLMELLARSVAHNDAGFADHAFVCGVMSLTPALLDMPLQQILAQVNLAAPISEALLAGKGRLGQMLGVVEAMESEDTAALADRLRELPMLHAEQLTAALADALRWANHIGEEVPE